MNIIRRSVLTVVAFSAGCGISWAGFKVVRAIKDKLYDNKVAEWMERNPDASVFEADFGAQNPATHASMRVDRQRFTRQQP